MRQNLGVANKMSIPNEPVSEVNEALPSWLETVRRQVGSLRFGQVQIVVHDAKVVQIERIEKIRLENKATHPG